MRVTVTHTVTVTVFGSKVLMVLKVLKLLNHHVRHVYATWWGTYVHIWQRGSHGGCTRHQYLIRGTW